MKLLHNVGTFQHSNYNTLEQIMACREPLSFDGIYRNVWDNRKILLGRKHPTVLFVMWDYVGKDNSFDAIPNKLPIEKYCDWNQLMDLVYNYNCTLASHTWTHRNLTLLSDKTLAEELQCPIPCKAIAYPYGAYNAQVIEACKKAGYTEGYRADDLTPFWQSPDENFTKGRSYL